MFLFQQQSSTQLPPIDTSALGMIGETYRSGTKSGRIEPLALPNTTVRKPKLQPLLLGSRSAPTQANKTLNTKSVSSVTESVNSEFARGRRSRALRPAEKHTSISFLSWPTTAIASMTASSELRNPTSARLSSSVAVKRLAMVADSNPEEMDYDLSLPSELDELDVTGDSGMLLLERWMGKYEGEIGSFASFSVYAEVKLREVYKITEHLEKPNRFQTAVCCDLLQKLSQTMPETFILPALLNQVFDSIYCRDLAAEKTSEPAGFLSGMPYYLDAKLLRAMVQAVQEKEKVYDYYVSQVEKQKQRQMFVLSMAHKQWQKSMTHNVFRTWVMFVRIMKRLRGVARRLLSIKETKQIGKREVFMEWKAAHNYEKMKMVPAMHTRLTNMEGRESKLREEIKRLESENKELRMTIRDQESALKSVRDNLVNVNEVVRDLGALALDNLHQRVKQLIEAVPPSSTVAGQPRGSDRYNDPPLALHMLLDPAQAANMQKFISTGGQTVDMSEDATVSATDYSLAGDSISNLTSAELSNVSFHGDLRANMDELSDQPVAEFLMRWANYHLTRSKVYGHPFRRRLRNLTTDLADGEVFAVLLHDITNGDVHNSVALTPNPALRCEKVLAVMEELRPLMPMQVTLTDLLSGDLDCNILLLGRMLLTHHSLTLPKEDTSFQWTKQLVDKKAELSDFMAKMKKWLVDSNLSTWLPDDLDDLFQRVTKLRFIKNEIQLLDVRTNHVVAHLKKSKRTLHTVQMKALGAIFSILQKRGATHAVDSKLLLIGGEPMASFYTPSLHTGNTLSRGLDELAETALELVLDREAEEVDEENSSDEEEES